MLLWLFIRPLKQHSWVEASVQTASAFEGGPGLAKRLRSWARAFISDRHALPIEMRGLDSRHSLLENEELKKILMEQLVKIGKYVRALDIVELLTDPEIQAEFGLKKTVCLSTAQVWMHELGFRWMRTPQGQYIDGHERPDVTSYRQISFLPRLAELDCNVPQYDPDNNLVSTPPPAPVCGPQNRPLLYLYHDESTFYAHDRREKRWVAPNEKAVPRKKGEGKSLMVADLICPEFGWFQSKDGERSARVIFRAGKARDGYFTNQDILDQLTTAMDICESDYPEYRFCFVLDNATTHLKRADDALSARHMSKGPTRPGNPMFGVETNVTGPDGKPVYRPDGKILKEKIRMRDARLPDGTPQSLYFTHGHPDAGVFKGMAQLLEERGFHGARQLRAECPGFKCPPLAERCCCRRLLYNQPDFREVETLVETHCHARGFEAVFLPKFHCELNPIEQCWCVAKRTYWEFPPSSLEADLEQNMVKALNAVTVQHVRKFYNRTQRFMDAYRKGLMGDGASWAAKRYSGHRTLPHNILAQFDKVRSERQKQ
ncbi:hypothetical protein K466DRAFT_490103 [Polyporus arcularius HHB13444]|uniref:Tc1-like transposase DDE domain-containing protein n=1 Tax=Polyporus arcularius HHB13444 TaxID=1314778 RepID=A0A5C3PFS6_9APHY|nr:hypothetical protein K466DRAFT_490103 [Polyporus arcularius HHB13444]